jgi:cytochrome c biogenesis protein CcdA
LLLVPWRRGREDPNGNKGSSGVKPEIAFAASAGVLAAFNPCGFALLPTYLALFVGSPTSRTSTLLRAAVVGTAVVSS